MQNGTYTTDLASLEIQPKFVYYKIGFIVPMEGQTGALDLDALKAAKPSLKLKLAEETKLDSIKFSELANFCGDCTATKETFKAIGAANLDDDADLDIWTVDHQGNFVHLKNDLSN